MLKLTLIVYEQIRGAHRLLKSSLTIWGDIGRKTELSAEGDDGTAYQPN